MRVSKNDTVCGLAAPAARQLMRTCAGTGNRLAGAGDAGIGTVILIGDHEHVCEDQSARRLREDPAAQVNLAGEMRATGIMEPEDGPDDIVQASGVPGAG